MANDKRVTNFTRSYSDAQGAAEILDSEGASVLNFSVGDLADSVVNAGILRFCSDAIVSAMNEAKKKGEDAIAAGAKVVEALKNGTYKFRAASGEGGLSVEEEQKVIAGCLVALGYATDDADATAKVATIYATTKTNAKGQTVRPDYNKLKAVPQIKAELAKAGKEDAGETLAGLGLSKVA